MAFDFSKLNFFKKLDARARVFVLFGGLVGVGILIYALVAFLSAGSGTTGPSRVASAPRGVQSVPGGQLTPEYYRALQEANQRAAQQAQISGGSAIPTFVNTGQQVAQGNCTVLCDDEAVNTADTIDDWVRKGKLSPDVANELKDLADRNVSVAEYAAQLDALVKAGKLTPEQARKLLEQYKQQHANAALRQSAKTMDELIKSGRLPIGAANELLEAQKNKVSPADYAAMLQRMVREGKIDAATAKRLLNEYIQQRAKEIIARSITSLRQMADQGQITNDVLNQLIPLEEQMVPVNQYQAKLDQLVNDGKLTPKSAEAIIEEFKQQKRDIGEVKSSVLDMLKEAEDAAYKELTDLLAEGKITKETASTLAGLIQKDVTFKEFAGVIKDMVADGRLTPEISKLKLADYKRVKGLRELAKQLDLLQGNDASAADYEAALRAAVESGVITPEEAAKLLSEYQAAKAQFAAATAAPVAQPADGNSELARLRQRLQESSAATQAEQESQPVTADQFSEAELASEAQLAEARQERIQNMVAAMSGQAQQLIGAWAPVNMQHTVVTPPETKEETAGDGTAATGTGDGTDTAANGTAAGEEKPALIKAGSVLFAVLDTGVNSDYKDSPVMATIVTGEYKGAKMLGKLVTTEGVSGQMDRVILNFTLMNTDDWGKSKSVTAYAIDPDTARTVLASSVNYHYLQRFGALMATSFLQGYGQAFLSSGGTSVASAFGTSQQNPELNPSAKLAVALGQMAQAVGEATKGYTERPPTVKVNAGVGLGILFMSDVT